MATKDGRAQIWYADTNGVITGNTPSADNVSSAIIDGYNEHFGTDIQIWTPETITLQVGDTVPNWNAYEKIVDTSQKIAVIAMSYQQNQTFIIGTLSGENFEIITNGSNSCGVNADGVVVSYNLPGADNTNYVKGLLQGKGIIASTITEKVVSWEIGDSVPDWSEYTQYT